MALWTSSGGFGTITSSGRWRPEGGSFRARRLHPSTVACWAGGASNRETGCSSQMKRAGARWGREDGVCGAAAACGQISLVLDDDERRNGGASAGWPDDAHGGLAGQASRDPGEVVWAQGASVSGQSPDRERAGPHPCVPRTREGAMRRPWRPKHFVQLHGQPLLPCNVVLHPTYYIAHRTSLHRSLQQGMPHRDPRIAEPLPKVANHAARRFSTRGGRARPRYGRAMTLGFSLASWPA
jgi:hypothetical protein